MKCTIDYFDSFNMKNRFNEPGKIIALREDSTAEVEINYPIRKRVIVPFSCVKVECIA